MTTPSLTTNFLGPRLVSMILQCFESGIIINQSVEYWSDVLDLDQEEMQRVSENGARSAKRTIRRRKSFERRWGVQLLVGFVTIAALFQTCITGHDTWHQFITNFNDLRNALIITWVSKMKPIMTVLMAAPVQAFLMWRCWILSGKNRLMMAVLVILWLGMIISSVWITINMFQPEFLGAAGRRVIKGETKIPVDMLFLSSLVFPGVLDICLTTMLITFLVRPLSSTLTRRFRRLLTRLIVIVWEAALPPCVCAVVAAITYVALERKSLWSLAFQAALGQLYVISLLITINGFREARLREEQLASNSSAVVGSQQRWLSAVRPDARTLTEIKTGTAPSTFPSSQDPEANQISGHSDITTCSCTKDNDDLYPKEAVRQNGTASDPAEGFLYGTKNGVDTARSLGV